MRNVVRLSVFEPAPLYTATISPHRAHKNAHEHAHRSSRQGAGAFELIRLAKRTRRPKGELIRNALRRQLTLARFEERCQSVKSLHSHHRVFRRQASLALCKDQDVTDFSPLQRRSDAATFRDPLQSSIGPCRLLISEQPGQSGRTI